MDRADLAGGTRLYVGEKLRVKRRNKGDAEDGWYLSIECNCDWEVEHGMQLVFRDGTVLSKVSAFDGHLTDSDAYSKSEYAGVIYVPLPPASTGEVR